MLWINAGWRYPWTFKYSCHFSPRNKTQNHLEALGYLIISFGLNSEDVPLHCMSIITKESTVYLWKQGRMTGQLLSCMSWRLWRRTQPSYNGETPQLSPDICLCPWLRLKSIYDSHITVVLYERRGVSNHRKPHCFFNSLVGLTAKKS